MVCATLPQGDNRTRETPNAIVWMPFYSLDTGKNCHCVFQHIYTFLPSSEDGQSHQKHPLILHPMESPRLSHYDWTAELDHCGLNSLTHLSYVSVFFYGVEPVLCATQQGGFLCLRFVSWKARSRRLNPTPLDYSFFWCCDFHLAVVAMFSHVKDYICIIWFVSVVLVGWRERRKEGQIRAII